VIEPDRSPCAGCSRQGGRRDFLRGFAGLAVMLMSGRPRALTAEVEYPVPAGDGAIVDRLNEVIVVRYRDECFAFALSCPHQNTALKWHPADNRFQCPKHKSKYAPDGVFISGRATRNMDRLPIRRAGSRLLVDADRVYESDKDTGGWAGAVVRLG
jgi:Rieske Fe-S protein